MSSYKFRRALWGIILSVLERPELSGGYVDPNATLRPPQMALTCMV
jgi:hypothetical protein